MALFLLLLISCSPVWAAEPEIADRLVVAVSGSSYSQRHIEVWFVVRELLQEATPVQKQKPKTSLLAEVAADWKTVLEKFSEDMTIRQEASRLGSFQPSAKAQVKANERISHRRSVDPELVAMIASLAISDDEISRFTATILQVEGFRKSRDRQGPGSKDAGSSSWLQELKSRAVTRIYDGGDTWVPLVYSHRVAPAPQKGKESQGG